MGFLNLSLYQHPSGKSFDPNKVVRKVKAAFPEARVLPGDQLAAEVRRAEVALAPQLREAPAGPALRVVESLRRKASAYGPAYAFDVPVPGGGTVRGLARSTNVQVLFDDPLPGDIHCRLTEFLMSLGLGRLEASTSAGQRQIVCDLAGPSDCVGEPEELVG